ncbi:DNA helicase RecQ [Selenomonadales bacterium OttesenSCG-928-I06]|nr:DNA helicase RecQ [Selenomonadales bacterium OttesenSCG-928-I06]
MQNKYKILESYFGYSEFRDGQEEIIDSILAKRDVLGIMPTGAGKSICYQIPAMLSSGITLVISPLISLMKDQVGALHQADIPAVYINSSLTASQQYAEIQKAREGRYKIIYIAPERLLSDVFLDFVQSTEISFISIDEAHCVSQWGQDFRPSYLRIQEFISSLSKRPVIGTFTATATPQVKEDIINLLGLKSPTIIATGFNRENLHFEVQFPKSKFKALVDFLENRKEKSGIVYCLTRKNVEETCERLCLMGYKATRYHAGLSVEERKENQELFQEDTAQIMIATNAFGMGIDKSNVSYVVHYNMPKNMESYYQEAGRAGRDGSPAECILFYSGQDVITNQFFIEKSGETEEFDPESLQTFKEHEREKLKQMTFYCHTTDCLRSFILKYFGERPPDYCGNCCNCLNHFEKVDVTVEAQKIMSCIARMNERFGIKLVIDTLRGMKQARIFELNLDQLSTYGIMKGFSEKQLREMINFLILNEYIAMTNSEYPTLFLTAKARPVLLGSEKLSMNLSKEQKPVEAQKPQKDHGENPVLYVKLKELRLELAREQGVPAYVIFPDTTLRDMCSKMPQTKEEFSKVSGVGKVKMERYCDVFLELIKQEAIKLDESLDF